MTQTSAQPSAPLDDATLARIEAIAGPVLREEKLRDWDPGYHADNFAAGAAVSPRSVDELCALLALCHAERIAVVTHGGRTGLVGGTASAPGSLIVSTRRLNGGIEIDPVGRVAIADAGVTLEALQQAAAEHGLSPGIDLPSRGSATLGGLAATNAGGIEAFRFGTMRDRLLGCEFVRADGTLVSDLARVLKNNTGYGLTDLIAGSEGTLGIITRLAIRLEPLRPVAATALFAFATIEETLAVARNLRDRFGDRLRAVEILWREYAETIAAQHGQSLEAIGIGEGAFLLLAETEETPEGDGQDKFLSHLEALFEEGLVSEAVLAQNNSQRDFFWILREDADVLFRVWPHVHSFDVSVPLANLGAYAGDIEPKLKQLADPVGVYIFGHLADGNLHVMLGLNDDLPHEAMEAILYPGLTEMGGAFSAEHGIGLEKREAFALYNSAAKHETMAAIKAALDPRGILNPGKIFSAEPH
ncbi:FAD-binding oxidoreductase [Mesorhizobium sp. KR2-14]|uniref:FAD-binding oxidoreductase n=1 Tax=Mesorhizobium sp. KR2-14 TaxID=3156610 RepID=UPI0032B4DF91